MSVETEKISCQLCGSDHCNTWGIKDGLTIVKCSSCDLVYVNPRPTAKALEEYYSLHYFTDGNYEEDLERLEQYKYEIDLMLPLVGSSGKFLDVGCAMGKFLNTLPDSFEKYGVEFSNDAAEFGRKSFGLNIKNGEIAKLKMDKEFFDIAHMRGVVEHLQSPLEDLKAVNRTLKNGAWFILPQTPNIGSWSGVVFRERHNQVFPNEHLTYFTPKTLGDMLGKAGFEVVSTSYPYIGTPYESWPKDIFNFFWNYISGKDSPPFWGNMMITYARKVRSV